MPNRSVVLGAIVGGGIVAFILLSRNANKDGKNDWQINPDFGVHRGLPAVYGGQDQLSVREPSAQDPQGGKADYLGYDYAKTMPGSYAKGEPTRNSGGRWYDKREDAWAFVEPNPIDYQKPPQRIPKLWKDANRYWDGITSYGGTEVMGQRVHLFHLRPSMPTRGVRSISGSLAKIGGGFSTASTARIPAVFIPTTVS